MKGGRGAFVRRAGASAPKQVPIGRTPRKIKGAKLAMKINMSQVQALYQAVTDYLEKLAQEISARWTQRRALRKQSLHAIDLCYEISEKISDLDGIHLYSLFGELIELGCSLETVFKVLEDMGYEISDDIFGID